MSCPPEFSEAPPGPPPPRSLEEAETQKGLGWGSEPRGIAMGMGCRVPALTTSPVASLAVTSL